MKTIKLLFTALLLLCSTAAVGWDVQYDNIYYKKTGESTIEVISSSAYFKYSGSVVIPKNVRVNSLSYTVTGIGSSAFSDCTGLTSIEIPNSVTYIGSDAFSGCTSLKNIEIPNSVTSIGRDAFSDCTGLTSITIPNSVTSIGYEAFNGTAWYNNQPNGVVYAGSLLYKYKGAMPVNTSIVVKEGTTGIGICAFEHCTRLTSIVIPNSVTSIGDYVFRGCTGLTSIEISNSVTRIGSSVFSGCSGLTSIEIPNSVTGIGSYAFYNCSGLTSIEIPNSVTYIGDYAFNGCTSLKDLRFEDGEGTLSLGYNSYSSSTGKGLFYDCPLETLYLGRHLWYNTGYNYGYSPFDNKTDLTSVTIGDSVTSIGNYVFSGCSGLTSIEIPNSVTSIGSYAFIRCSGLTSIEIPNSVTSIGTSAFYGCSGLTSIEIPNSVTSIGTSAFYGCSGLTSIEIPNSVTSIGSSVFSGCTGLTSIEIPNSVTSIGDDAFSGCTGLTSIEIPNSVTSIGYDAFENCSGLTSIEIPNSVTIIGSYAFYNCSGLKTVINFSNLTFSKGSSYNGYIAYYADKVINAPNGFIDGEFVWFKNEGGIVLAGYLGNATELTLPADYKGESYAIGSEVFKNNTTLTSIEIPNSATSIGSYAFKGCTGLEKVGISDLATWCGIDFGSADANPLYYAKSLYLNGELLTELVVPDGVATIKNHAFNNCAGLASIAIPNSVTSVGDDAFAGCSNVEKLDLDCTEVGDWFCGVSAMKEVTIGNGVASVVASAFNGCTGLEKVGISDLDAWCGIDFGSADANPLYYAKNLYLNGELLTELSIPAEIAEVKDYAFYNCKGVTNIDIVDGVKSIGNSAFYGCSDLETLYISNKIESIGDYAFAECNNVLDIKIGSKKAITASENIFSSDAYNNACLYVPTGRSDFYAKTSPWSNFIIKEMDFTGIDEVYDEVKGENGKGKTVYDLNGRAVENPTTGIYIINGKKVLVK